MSEPMREVTEGLDVTGVDQVYPGARKVTVDEANRTAYVFGRGNRATVVRGTEYEALVTMLPPSVEQQSAEPVEVEPVEAVISVVAEQEVPAEPPAKARPGRGSKKES